MNNFSNQTATSNNCLNEADNFKPMPMAWSGHHWACNNTCPGNHTSDEDDGTTRTTRTATAAATATTRTTITIKRFSFFEFSLRQPKVEAGGSNHSPPAISFNLGETNQKAPANAFAVGPGFAVVV